MFSLSFVADGERDFWWAFIQWRWRRERKNERSTSLEHFDAWRDIRAGIIGLLLLEDRTPRWKPNETTLLETRRPPPLVRSHCQSCSPYYSSGGRWCHCCYYCCIAFFCLPLSAPLVRECQSVQSADCRTQDAAPQVEAATRRRPSDCDFLTGDFLDT